MCQAIRELIEDGRQEGISAGRMEGRMEGRMGGHWMPLSNWSKKVLSRLRKRLNA